MELAFSIGIETFGISFDTKSFWNGRPDFLVEIHFQYTKELVKLVKW
jgi:hypothetical protein